MSLYLWLDILAVIVPLIFSFHTKIRFDKEWKYFFPSNFIIAFIFVLWDIYFTKINVWSFNSNYTCGLNFAGLPLEEYLFFIFIPYCCSFTFHAFRNNIRGDINNLKPLTIIYILIAVVLVITGLTNIQRYYTSSAFITAALILFSAAILFPQLLKYLTLTYLAILLPFLIINGILTGSFLPEPVVGYNNEYNLNIRIFTIPLEDFFYGMTLIFGNILLSESLKKKSERLATS